MGSPLSAILANSYLKHYESIWLSQAPANIKPAYYKRYLDDTFLLFSHKHQVLPFLNFLNQQLPNIKFTKEEESENSLPFLDILINKNSTNYNLSIYRKPTFTNLSQNFFSHVPFRYKCNSIKTLIYRAFHLSSNYHNLHKEFDFLVKFFNSNLYPSSLIYTLIKRFLTSIFYPKIQPLTVPKLPFFVKLPFYDHSYLKLKNALQKVLQTHYPHIKFNFIFTPNRSIGSFLNHKEPLPTHLRSSVIYKYICGVCNDSYVGSTQRQLALRTEEHRGRSARTGNLFTSPNPSSIRNHSHSKDHPIDPNHFSIITQTNQLLDLKILESIHISSLKPLLNDDSGPFQLLLF
jgi:hypothetical protein